MVVHTKGVSNDGREIASDLSSKNNKKGHQHAETNLLWERTFRRTCEIGDCSLASAVLSFIFNQQNLAQASDLVPVGDALKWRNQYLPWWDCALQELYATRSDGLQGDCALQELYATCSDGLQVESMKMLRRKPLSPFSFCLPKFRSSGVSQDKNVQAK